MTGKRVFGRLLATSVVAALDGWVGEEIRRGSTPDAIGRAILSVCGGVLGNLVAGTQVESAAHLDDLAREAGSLLSANLASTCHTNRAMRGLPPIK